MCLFIGKLFDTKINPHWVFNNFYWKCFFRTIFFSKFFKQIDVKIWLKQFYAASICTRGVIGRGDPAGRKNYDFLKPKSCYFSFHRVTIKCFFDDRRKIFLHHQMFQKKSTDVQALDFCFFIGSPKFGTNTLTCWSKCSNSF